MSKHEKIANMQTKERKNNQQKVRSACEELQLKGVDITYKTVAEIVGLSPKSLQREHYSTIINEYRSNKKHAPSVELIIQNYKDEISHLRLIIDKQKQQINNLLLETWRSL